MVSTLTITIRDRWRKFRRVTGTGPPSDAPRNEAIFGFPVPSRCWPVRLAGQCVLLASASCWPVPLASRCYRSVRLPPLKVQPAVELFARVDNLCDASYQDGVGLSMVCITAGRCGRPRTASVGLWPKPQWSKPHWPKPQWAKAQTEETSGSVRSASRRCLAMVAIMAAFGPACAFAGEPPPPTRVVSLDLCTDQLLIELAQRDRIAAVTHLAADPAVSAIPEKARGIPFTHGNAEDVLRYDPDL